MVMSTLDTATKTELRILCKAQGVKGYGSMNNDQMREALKEHDQPRGNGDEDAAVEVYQQDETAAAVAVVESAVEVPAESLAQAVADAENDRVQNPDSPEAQVSIPAPAS